MRVGTVRKHRTWRDARHVRSVLVMLGALLAMPGVAAAQGAPTPEMSPGAQPVPDDQGVYKPDPTYNTNPYDPKAQIDIYGGKHAIDEPRPIEALRLQYEGGPF